MVVCAESEVLVDFSKKIVPSLLKRWLECSPSDPFTSTANLEWYHTSSTTAQLNDLLTVCDRIDSMALVLDIIHMLFILNGKSNKHKEGEQAAATQTSAVFNCFLADFRKYLMPHFPITEPISKSVEVLHSSPLFTLSFLSMGAQLCGSHLTVRPLLSQDKKSKEGAHMRLTVSRLNCTLCAIMAHFVEPKAIKEMELEEEEEARTRFDSRFCCGVWVQTCLTCVCAVIYSRQSSSAPKPAPLPAFLQKREDKVRDADDEVMKTVAESKRPDKWMTAVYRHVVKKLQDKETAGNKVRFALPRFFAL
jgi:hypothetical protein